jgi:hypothetical protein
VAVSSSINSRQFQFNPGKQKYEGHIESLSVSMDKIDPQNESTRKLLCKTPIKNLIEEEVMIQNLKQDKALGRVGTEDTLFDENLMFTS